MAKNPPWLRALRASLSPSRIESFNAGRAEAHTLPRHNHQRRCGSPAKVVIRPRFLNDVSTLT